MKILWTLLVYVYYVRYPGNEILLDIVGEQDIKAKTSTGSPCIPTQSKQDAQFPIRIDDFSYGPVVYSEGMYILNISNTKTSIAIEILTSICTPIIRLENTVLYCAKG